jgi:hypothetical protein
MAPSLPCVILSQGTGLAVIEPCQSQYGIMWEAPKGSITMAQATGPRTQKSHVVKVTGVSDELLGLLDSRVLARHATGRSEYIRELLKRDLIGEPTFRQILAPMHAQGRELPDTEEELDVFFDKVRDEVYAERQASNP